MERQIGYVYLLVGLVGLTAFGCGASGTAKGSGPGSGSGANSGTAGDSGSGAANTGGSTSLVVDAGDAGAANEGVLTIAPLDPVLELVVDNGQITETTLVGGGAVPLTFSATSDGVPTDANWSIDRGEIGVLSPDTGVFTPGGVFAGVANVTAQAGSVTASTSVTVRIKATQNGIPDGETDSPGLGGLNGVGGEGRGGPVDAATQERLRTEAPTAANLQLIYPYDQTVWPRGIPAPLLQWNIDKSPTSVYIHLTQENYEFEGFYSKPAATPFIRHPFEPSAWKAALNSNGGDQLHVEVKLADDAGVYGPMAQDYTIAPGQLKGTVYYYSYNTSFANPSPNSNRRAGVLSIKAGALEPTAALQGMQDRCIACHTISDDGSTLFANEGVEEPGGASDGVYYDRGIAFDLRNGGTVIQEYDVTYPGVGDWNAPNARKWVFPALWRDGSFGIRSSVDKWGYPDGDQDPNGGWGFFQADRPIFDAAVFRRDDASQMTVDGLDGIKTMVTPVFSPNGKMVVFNYWDGTAGLGGGGGDTLDLMDVDCTPVDPPPTNGEPACSALAFSNLRRIYTYPPGTSSPDNYVGWPAWTPDSKGIVFQKKITGDYWAGNLTTFRNAKAQIWYLPIPDDQSTIPTPVLLAQLNGSGYLPTGTGHNDDEKMNYEPTVNPIASGGYYWVVMTSRRLYGNVATSNPYATDGTMTDPTTKKLWVAAIDINPEPGKDPSHPGFYLPGQELPAPNMRGFWVVDPCKNLGDGCETGDECCGGFCRPDTDGALTCSEAPVGCANEFEKCTTDADCCGYVASGGGFLCINDHCAKPSEPPVK
ncbi:MAG TPA: hypothetical protein VGP93_07325 [Polyangiaceae bacterium]|nr:hypothetical protein [Polyangiaceae bacterium]